MPGSKIRRAPARSRSLGCFSRPHVDEPSLNGSARSHATSVSTECSSVHDQYELLEVIGSGASGCVHRAVCKATGEEVAVKQLLSTANAHDTVYAQTEHKLNHRISNVEKCRQFVVPLARPSLLEDALLEDCDERSYSMVFKLMKGGCLADLVLQQGCSLSEADCKRVMFNVFSAIAALHNNDVAHCDIKLANLVLETPGDYSTAKLIDLGLAHDLRESKRISCPAGTPSYFSPECVRVYVAGQDNRALTFGREADQWAAGVVMCELLTGSKLFQGATTQQVFAQIFSMHFQNLQNSGGPWENISAGAKDLLRRCLDHDCKTRITAKQALAHRWFDDVRPKSGTSVPRPVKAISGWVSRSKLTMPRS